MPGLQRRERERPAELSEPQPYKVRTSPTKSGPAQQSQDQPNKVRSSPTKSEPQPNKVRMCSTRPSKPAPCAPNIKAHTTQHGLGIGQSTRACTTRPWHGAVHRTPNHNREAPSCYLAPLEGAAHSWQSQGATHAPPNVLTNKHACMHTHACMCGRIPMPHVLLLESLPMSCVPMHPTCIPAPHCPCLLSMGLAPARRLSHPCVFFSVPFSYVSPCSKQHGLLCRAKVHVHTIKHTLH